MAKATRELSIQYGNLLIGGTGNYEIDGHVRVRKSFQSAEVEFSFVIAEATEAAFGAAITAVEDGLTKPFQDLTIMQGGTVLHTYKHDEATGFDVEPEVRKEDSIADTGRSRRYTVVATFGMPADQVSDSTGLRTSTIDVAYAKSRRRTVTISGVYTAVGSSTARAIYESNAETYAQTVLTALTGTFELVEEPATTHNRTNRTIEFERVYREILFGQAGNAGDDPDIVDQVLTVRRFDEGPGDSLLVSSSSPATVGGGGSSRDRVRRLTRIELNYEAEVDSDNTTDLKGKYTNLRPWLILQLENSFDVGAIALVEEAPEFIQDDNRIRVRMVALSAAEGQALYERSVTIEDDDDPGATFTGAWTGDPEEHYVTQGHRTLIRTTTVTAKFIRELDSKEAMEETDKAAKEADGSVAENEDAGGQGGGAAGFSGGSGSWIKVGGRASVTPKTIGINGHTLLTTEVTATSSRRRVKRARSKG